MMKVDDYARTVTEDLARKAALKSPEAAASRFIEHQRRWLNDMRTRPEVYDQAVQAALSPLHEIERQALTVIWEGMKQQLLAETEAERAAIDIWLAPLVAAAPSIDGLLSALDSVYFTAAIEAELDALADIPGYLDTLERFAHERE